MAVLGEGLLLGWAGEGRVVACLFVYKEEWFGAWDLGFSCGSMSMI